MKINSKALLDAAALPFAAWRLKRNPAARPELLCGSLQLWGTALGGRL
jgi:hypothetical protein